MRKDRKSKIKIRLLNILILLLFCTINAGIVSANMQSIHIQVEPEEVNENDYFKVSAFIITESEGVEFLVEVNITFENQIYKITEQSDNYEVKIKAPPVDYDKSYIIYATKNGYKTNYTQIIVRNIKPTLKIVPQDYIITAGDYFYVTVYENNKDGNTVEGANVYISNYGDTKEITKIDGKAYFYAPKDREEIKIIASKLGYTTANETIKIKLQQSLVSQITNNKFFLIVLSTFVLIFSILFVHFRQKKNIYIHAKEISNQKTLEKYISESDKSDDKVKFESEGFIRPSIRGNQAEDSRVEEIRISRPSKKKEIVDIKTNKEYTGSILNKKNIQRPDNKWFEGIDEIRYEIDKITGETNEESKDKWFEGVNDFKKKIDERIKKKNKKY